MKITKKKLQELVTEESEILLKDKWEEFTRHCYNRMLPDFPNCKDHEKWDDVNDCANKTMRIVADPSQPWSDPDARCRWATAPEGGSWEEEFFKDWVRGPMAGGKGEGIPVAEEKKVPAKGKIADLIREETVKVLTEAVNAETREIAIALDRIGYKVKHVVEVDDDHDKRYHISFEKALHPGVGWISRLDVKQKSFRDPKRREKSKKTAPEKASPRMSALSLDNTNDE